MLHIKKKKIQGQELRGMKHFWGNFGHGETQPGRPVTEVDPQDLWISAQEKKDRRIQTG